MMHRLPWYGFVLNSIRIRSFLPLLCLLAALPFTASGQALSFADNVYPALEEAQCRQCHQEQGVASATRLKFPAEDAAAPLVNAFGLSLVRLVDREEPARSLLLQKPTNRVAHGGGERIPAGSDKEKVLLSWVGRLAGLSDREAAKAISEWDRPTAPTEPIEAAVLRRLTNNQYDNTVRDLLKDFSRPATRFPAEDYVNGYKNQYEVVGRVERVS
jgi:hypothetical protein